MCKDKIGIRTVIVLILLLTLMPFDVSAAFPDLPNEEWDSFDGAVPDDIKDALGSNAFDSEEKYFEEIEKISKSENIAALILDTVGLKLGEVGKLFLLILSLLVLAALFSAVSDGVDNPALSSALRFCSSGALCGSVVYIFYSHFGMLEEFFEKLGTMMNGMIPITASIWAMGGNVSTAGAGSATFYVMLSLCEGIWSKTVIPVCCVLTVLGFCDAMSEEVRTGRIMNAVKKIYNFILGLIMTVLLSSLAAQTALAASADTTAARAARLVSGTVIPVIGGSVGETFRTVAAGVSYLKNIFGVGGIVMIILLVLPIGISVLLTRFVFLICGGIADMLGCSVEARLLENLGEVYGCMLGVIVGASTMFIMALCVFMQTVVAVA